MGKRKMLVIIILVTIALLAFDRYAVDNKEEIKEAVKQEQQVEQPAEEKKEEPKQEKEEPKEEQKQEEKTEIKDEYLTEEDLPKEEVKISQIDDAYDLAKPYVDQAFGPTGLDYRLNKETVDGVEMVVLVINISEQEIAATDMNTWNTLKDGAVSASQNMKILFDQRGYYNVHFAIMVGDASVDSYYLMVGDGEVIMDIPNGVY